MDVDSFGGGGDGLPRLDAYPVAADAPAPAVLVLPGGGYHTHATHEAEPVAEWLNGLGITAFVLRYRMAPHRFPAPLEDALAALRHIRQNAPQWTVDPARVGVLGFSAGGHLAGLLATEPGTPPALAVLCYPVTMLYGPTRHEGSAGNLLGADATDERRRALSTPHRVDDHTPPTFVWHTADDPVVPVGGSLLLAGALDAHGVPFELHVYPHGRHGLGLTGDWLAACATFLRTNGFGPAGRTSPG